jgi:hypothetical protein
MSTAVPREILTRVRKLALLPGEIKQSRWAVSITKLTTLKSLCQEPEVANRFVVYLARKTLERVQHGKGRSAHLDTEVQALHKELMTDALPEMEAWLEKPSADRRQRLLDLQGRMRGRQNEHKNIPYGAVRLIHDWDLLVFENALSCMLYPAHAAGHWSYQLARDYAERYNPSEGTGLISTSVPLVQDIVDFWLQELKLDPAALTSPPAKKGRQAAATLAGSGEKKPAKRQAQPTPRQGQFLAFIHLYRKLHRQGPSEQDMALYFGVKPAGVRAMLAKLKELGLVNEKAGDPRSLRVSSPKGDIPALEDVQAPPW